MAANKGKNRKRNQERNSQEKRNTISSILKVMVTFLVIIIASVIILTGSIKVEIGKSDINFSATFSGSAKIQREDIKSITYKKNLDRGNRSFGIGSVKLQSGKFENEAYGNYKLFSYSKCEEYVVIETENEGYIVVNDETPKKTKELYKELETWKNE